MELRERNTLKIEETWSVDEMYPTLEAIESDFERLEALLAEIAKMEGKLTDSVQSLFAGLELRDSIWKISSNLYTYSRMKKDEDNRIAERQALFDRAAGASVRTDSAISYFVPELLAADEDRLRKLMESDLLKDYRFYIEDVLRRKSHTLSAPEERLLAMSGEMAASPRNIFSMMNNADIQFGKILNERGEEVELTKGNYVSFMESPDRGVRKSAYEALYKAYVALKNTIGTTLISACKKDTFYAKARNYDSVLEMSLDDDQVPDSVYDGLVAAVRENLPIMHRYVDIRRKILKLDTLGFYDLYVPLVHEANQKITYEEAVSMVQSGLAPLGKDYGEVLRQGFDNRWIDIYETPGKTSGAYSWGTYDSKPFVMLNYQENLNYVFTIAHEMGHSLHSYLSRRAQPYINSDYKIFVAEVASTVNEALLMQHLLAQEITDTERLFLLNHFMEQYKGTVYRQTMFAEFEKTVHGLVDQDEPVTTERLCEIYSKLNRDYYGPMVEMDELIPYEWMRIPHFYSPFYVYKYATGFSAAMAISRRILDEGEPAVADYLRFLSSGGSDHPIELLKIAGVDMTSPETVNGGLKIFSEILDKAEVLIERL